MGLKVLVSDYAWKDLEVEAHILARIGASLVVAKTGAEPELTELANDVDGILTCWKPVTAKVIENSPRCISIGRYGIGLDNIDVAFATQRGIVVTNVPSYCVEEVSDHALALILACARKVAFYNQAIKGGVYDLRAQVPLFRIKGRTLGIVGFGKIGRSLGQKAAAVGLKVIVFDPVIDSSIPSRYQAESVTFDDLLSRSDFISIHTPLNAQTRRLFNADVLRQMKSTAFLVNTSRGEIVDPQALLSALDQGTIAGAALDVLPQEPPATDDPLLLHPKAIMTPHVAFYSEESLAELRSTAALQMADVLTNNRPGNIVNPEVLKQPNLRAKFTTSVR